MEQTGNRPLVECPMTRRFVLRALGVTCLGLLAAACAPAPPASPPPAAAPAAAPTSAPAAAPAPTSAVAASRAGGCGGSVTEGTNGDGSIVNPTLLVDSDGYWRTSLIFDP